MKKKILVITHKNFNKSWKNELTKLFGRQIVFTEDEKVRNS